MLFLDVTNCFAAFTGKMYPLYTMYPCWSFKTSHKNDAILWKKLCLIRLRRWLIAVLLGTIRSREKPIQVIFLHVAFHKYYNNNIPLVKNTNNTTLLLEKEKLKG